MATFKARIGDKIIPVEADTPEQAALLARMRFAAESGVSQAQAGAQERNYEGMNPTQMLAMARESAAEQMPPASAAGGLAAFGAAVNPAFALSAAKDLGIYGAAEGAEKLLGLPKWTGEVVGAVSPARSLGKLLLGGAFGGAKRAATGAVAEKAAEAAPAAMSALEAEKLALRKRAIDLAEKRLERQIKLDAERAARRATPKTTVKPEVPSPDATIPATPAAEIAPPRPVVSGPAVASPGDSTALLTQKIQQQMGTVEGRRAVREWLATQPKELQDQIKALLAKGQAGWPTNLGGHALPAPAPSGPGYELAKLLGQVQ